MLPLTWSWYRCVVGRQKEWCCVLEMPTESLAKCYNMALWLFTLSLQHVCGGRPTHTYTTTLCTLGFLASMRLSGCTSHIPYRYYPITHGFPLQRLPWFCQGYNVTTAWSHKSVLLVCGYTPAHRTYVLSACDLAYIVSFYSFLSELGSHQEGVVCILGSFFVFV